MSACEACARSADRLDLIELVNRYGRGVDRRDEALLGEVFAEDATADYSLVVARTRRADTTIGEDAVLAGREAIVAWLMGARSSGEDLRHFMTNHIVDALDGDRGAISCYVHERLGAYGAYEIEAERRQGRWQITRLVLDLHPRPSKRATDRDAPGDPATSGS